MRCTDESIYPAESDLLYQLYKEERIGEERRGKEYKRLQTNENQMSDGRSSWSSSTESTESIEEKNVQILSEYKTK